MQIHVEAHLVLKRNTSVSEFAMKTFPPSTPRPSLPLFAPAQCRAGVGGQDQAAGPLPMVSVKVHWSWLRFKNRNNVAQLENVFYSVLLPWIWMSTVLIGLVFDLSLIFFFFAINSASLWDPNFGLMLNFVLLLHQLGWSQCPFCLFHGSGPRLQLPQCISQVCE